MAARMSTFAGRYDEPLLKLVGNRLIPATSAAVTVFESDGSTEATLYADRTKATAADNPTAPDAVGNLEFFADPGTYVLSIVEDSSVVATNTVTVFNDPEESGAVDSVNGKTGTVVLNADDISDTSTTKKFTTAARNTKIDSVETGATADQTGGEIKTAYEAELDTNAYTDSEKTKLAGVESGATADQTGAEIKTAYEAEANTNAYTDAEKTKLAGVESGATADQTAAEILTAIKTVDGASSGLDADLLDGQEASEFANVTNVPVAVSGTTDTLASADNGKINRYTNASAVTVTIPTDATDDLADGFNCTLVAEGAGGLTLSTTGITITGSANTTIAQGEALVVIKTATADTWLAIGGTSA